MTYNTLKELYETMTHAVNNFGLCEIPSWSAIKKAKKEGRLIANKESGYIKTASMNPHEQYTLIRKE